MDLKVSRHTVKKNMESTRWSHLVKEIGWHIAPPVVFLIVVYFFFPYNTIFEFSKDEGLDLMKALLVERGYTLYGEIWSDQPPLFTHILATAFHFFGYKVGLARFIVLLISAGMLWAASQFMRIIGGNKLAVVTALMLFILPRFMTLSVSIMIGQVAIAFAVISMLGVAYWHRNRRYFWLGFSAVLLGASVLTKLFTGFLAPIFILGIIAAEYVELKEQRKFVKVLKPAVIWSAAFGIFTAALGFYLVGWSNLPQLINVHLLATEIQSFTQEATLNINAHLGGALPVLFLALVGAVMALLGKRWLTLYPLIWSVAAYIMLFFHAPVWEHHQMLITIPAAMIGSIAALEGATSAVQIIRENYKGNIRGFLQAAAILGFFALFLTFNLPQSLKLLQLPRPTANASFEIGPLENRFFMRMLKYAPETNWVVTDLPMYAFRARLPVPPNLAVSSLKRWSTGALSEQDFLNAIQEYHPEQVLLGRFEYRVLDEYLQSDYRLVHAHDNMRLYVRKDLKGS